MNIKGNTIPRLSTSCWGKRRNSLFFVKQNQTTVSRAFDLFNHGYNIIRKSAYLHISLLSRWPRSPYSKGSSLIPLAVPVWSSRSLKTLFKTTRAIEIRRSMRARLFWSYGHSSHGAGRTKTSPWLGRAHKNQEKHQNKEEAETKVCPLLFYF